MDVPAHRHDRKSIQGVGTCAKCTQQRKAKILRNYAGVVDQGTLARSRSDVILRHEFAKAGQCSPTDVQLVLNRADHNRGDKKDRSVQGAMRHGAQLPVILDGWSSLLEYGHDDTTRLNAFLRLQQ